MHSVFYTTHETIVGVVLRNIRKLAQENQAKVAKTLGLNVSTYSRIENGHTALTVTQLRTICDHFQIKTQDFYDQVEKLENKVKSLSIQIVNEGAVYLDTFSISKIKP